ncbi:P-loop containing nucleoside triphosphate hydrolase protein [Basidiobolus meristosporus CBS 931.73]|uniref:p-loop containing nucleoside triphosphate hydrolase protein n=1 Tax=Basidiobolus meristosporus CBS 931.73 TaxID=1314790 RepID=A0A1Y1XAM7_9FUNG|nr:P-loop containing nucleoside triphosphate hydrolase protein [Basidiobolus meristosporus CBS 931.73]|eukprot:ORX82790.1 P-loop containing nucleoside triphosphate hydrolase protein [Basidiobolus meristosporus CBS 931.73]
MTTMESNTNAALKKDDFWSSVSAVSQASRFHKESTENQSKDVDLPGVNLAVNSVDLLLDSRLLLKAGTHYGLIGRNGIGKSTLLKSIGYGKLIGFPKNISTLYIEQLQESESQAFNRTVFETVLSVNVQRCKLMDNISELEDALEVNTPAALNRAAYNVMAQQAKEQAELDNQDAIKRSGKRGMEARAKALQSEANAAAVSEQLANAEALPKIETSTIYEMLSEFYDKLTLLEDDDEDDMIRDILNGLGFSQKQQDAPVSELSGGWRMRVALAQALYMKPDILLLDEPTNHLDLPAIVWLRSYLSSITDQTLVIISHDRHFLNSVVDEIICFKNKTLTYHPGNYDDYKKNTEDVAKKKQHLHDNIEKKKKHIQKSIEKAVQHAKSSGDDKRLGLVASRKKKLERMGMDKTEDGKRFKVSYRVGWHETARVQVELEKAEPSVTFTFPQPDPLRNNAPMLQLRNISFKYPGAKADVVTSISISIEPGSRIGLVGANGSGKSTLVDLINGTLRPTKGTIERNPSLRIGYFSQHHVDLLNIDNESAVTYIKKKVDEGNGTIPLKDTQEIRRYIGNFGLSGNVPLQPLNTLSGGQKSRVALAITMLTNPHLLLLDEITNHLDLESIEGLREAIATFAGAVVLVTHDQYFVQETCGQNEDDEAEDSEAFDSRIYVVRDHKVRLIDDVQEYVDSL